MPNTNPVQILSAVSYFAGLDAVTLESVAQSAIQKSYDADQIVLLEGEADADLYIVQSGWLKVVKLSADGREHILNFVEPGEAFNAISVFVETPNPATVIALEATIVWLVHQETMRQLLDAHPSLAQGIIRNLAGRVLHLVTMVADLSLQSVETRLARLFLDRSSEEGIIYRRRWATQSEMASRLGTVPDVLGRILQNFAAAGLIQVERRQIRILDRTGLEEKAKPDE